MSTLLHLHHSIARARQRRQRLAPPTEVRIEPNTGEDHLPLVSNDREVRDGGFCWPDVIIGGGCAAGLLIVFAELLARRFFG